jgi:3-deoxy-D-manno-octulosonate 8-phosphate phosphatase KdsC-like HAD superfamily phosphatase
MTELGHLRVSGDDRNAESTTRCDIDVAMLTGDNKGTAERIAKSLGIDIVFADVLAGDKASKVKELQLQQTRIQHRRPAPSTSCTETGKRNVLWWR